MTKKRNDKNRGKGKKGGGPSRGKSRSGRNERESKRKTPQLTNDELLKAADATTEALKKWAEEGAKVRAELAANPFVPTKLNLDPWQKQAVDHLIDGRSVVVDAPTTAGKTRVVESFFQKNISDPNFRACYTTPVKSLSNDKLREFREMFGSENVGIATGDIKDNLNAPIVVATLESYRNSLLGVEPDLGRQLVIFDEYHYLQDSGRGSAWEEAMILTPPSCQLLLLSASVRNGEDFCSWINNLGQNRDCKLVQTKVRPVPLADLIFYENQWFLSDTLPDAIRKDYDRQLMAMPLKPDQFVDRLVPLVDLELTPTIVYCSRRLSCEQVANMIARKMEPLPEEQRKAIGDALMQIDKECGALKFIPQGFRNMLQSYGVGYHHSGIAPPGRIAVEFLIKNGLLRFCTATMGLSLGINFAVRSTIIADYKRPGDMGFQTYTKSEVLQMVGRAGRRGRDTIGYSLWPTRESYKKLRTDKREDCFSRLKNDPTTFLGLVGRGFSLRGIEKFYSKSFLRYQDSQVDLSLITKKRLQKKFEGKELPCASPAAEVARFWYENDESACTNCSFRKQCHKILEDKMQSPLAALHIHLHSIGAIERDESLSNFGNVARYLPQAGGLILSKMISQGEITAENLGSMVEMFTAMTLARFKEPSGTGGYRPPFDAKKLEEDLEEYYPESLFPELYDPPFGQRSESVIKEFNPNAGYILKEWVRGADWDVLTRTVTTERYGAGDCMALIYRVCTYLQSVSQIGLEVEEDLKSIPIRDLKKAARILRDELLREPLAFALTV
jgi:hypothetical protein